jgi:hypothetical protein
MCRYIYVYPEDAEVKAMREAQEIQVYILCMYICMFEYAIVGRDTCLHISIQAMREARELGSHDTMLAPSKNMVLVSQRYNLVVV